MNIVLVSGSASGRSHTLALLQHVKKTLEEKGHTVTLWDLLEKRLPLSQPAFHQVPLQHPDLIVREFAQLILSADAIVLGTPLYHGSYSGLLKNALDSVNKDIFKNKPVGLVGNCGTRGTNGFEHLSAVVRALYGYSLQTQIATESSDYLVQENSYLLDNKEILARCQRFMNELLYLAHSLKKETNESNTL